jgi:membrane protein
MAAAALAFWWFLAIFPALIATVGIFALVAVDPEVVASTAEGIRSVVPGEAADLITEGIGNATRLSAGASLAAGIIGVVAALWTASSGMVAVQEALDVAYGVPQSRPFLKKRGVALVLVVATGVLGAGASALVVFGDATGEAIRDATPLGSVFMVVWAVLRWVLSLFALTVLFAIYYYLGPNRDGPSWKWITPGGAVATVLWILASLGLSLYVSTFGSYGETYGPLAGVAILLLWLFLTGIAVILGGELNAEVERQGDIKRRGRRP